MGAYVDQPKVEAYLSSPVVVDTYDDNNDGAIDAAAIGRVITDAEAIFNATVRGIYELPLVGTLDPFVETVVLQLVHCQAIRRFPERFRNGLKVCEHVKELLTDIRKGNVQLGHPLLANARGPEVLSAEPRNYDALEHTSDED